MSKPIYYCNVTVVKITKRGKTIVKREPISFTLPMVVTDIEKLDEKTFEMQCIARKIFVKGSTEDTLSDFKKNYIIEKIERIKQVGVTNAIDVIPDEEWI